MPHGRTIFTLRKYKGQLQHLFEKNFINFKTHHLMHRGWRVIIVVMQVGGVRIYVAAVEALRKKERGDETQFTTKIGGKTSLGPSYYFVL